jgi:hypothetical protein
MWKLAEIKYYQERNKEKERKEGRKESTPEYFLVPCSWRFVQLFTDCCIQRGGRASTHYPGHPNLCHLFLAPPFIFQEIVM